MHDPLACSACVHVQHTGTRTELVCACVFQNSVLLRTKYFVLRILLALTSPKCVCCVSVSVLRVPAPCLVFRKRVQMSYKVCVCQFQFQFFQFLAARERQAAERMEWNGGKQKPQIDNEIKPSNPTQLTAREINTTTTTTSRHRHHHHHHHYHQAHP